MDHPMFSEEHVMFRESLRKFVKKEIAPNAEEWAVGRVQPQPLYKFEQPSRPRGVVVENATKVD